MSPCRPPPSKAPPASRARSIEHAADRQEARHLERLQQEARSEGRAAEARDEARRSDRKRVAARLARWIEARREAKASAPLAGGVAARRFRFLRDVARRGGGDPRGRPGGASRSGRPDDLEATRLLPAGGRFRPIATARLADMRRQAGLRREAAKADALRDGERDVQWRLEGVGADRLDASRRVTQAEEGRIVEKRRLDLEEQARLDEARRRDRDLHERQIQRKRQERDDHERQVQQKRQERGAFDESYQRKKRERDEAEREDQRKRDEEDLRNSRSHARDQAARQAAGLAADGGDVGAAEAAEFGPDNSERRV